MKPLKKILTSFIDTLFLILLTPILYSYERFFMYRIKNCWGKVHEYNINNKGKNVKIVGYGRFLDANKLSLGNNVRIGYGAFFFCKGGIAIGDNTIISRNVVIYSANHNYEGEAIPFDNNYTKKKVTIGNGVWVGMGVMITPGVTIGDGAIIGMGTVVSKDVKPGEILVGSGQKTLKYREADLFIKNNKKQRYFADIWPNL